MVVQGRRALQDRQGNLLPSDGEQIRHRSAFSGGNCCCLYPKWKRNPCGILVVQQPQTDDTGFKNLFRRGVREGLPAEKISKENHRIFAEQYIRKKLNIKSSALPFGGTELSGICVLENHREKYSSLRFGVNSKEISPGFVVCRPSRIPLSASWTATWSTFQSSFPCQLAFSLLSLNWVI